MSTSHAPTVDALTAADYQQQFLTFVLEGEKYAVEILSVQEIRGFEPVTPIPGSPPWSLGVLNLRGSVVPVIDLRARLGMAPRTQDRHTVNVILSVDSRLTGLVVDAVSDVVEIPHSQIDAVPVSGIRAEESLLLGVARRTNEMILILDVKRAIREEAEASTEWGVLRA